MIKIDKSGDTWHYNEQGQLHRTDGPAAERSGDKFYFISDKLHRTDGPAVELANGYKSYWIGGKLHRTEGPAIEWESCYDSIYITSLQQNDAVQILVLWVGAKEYWVNGQRHRTDGPAVEFINGNIEYWINNQQLTWQEFRKYVAIKKLAGI
jgi:hypothetical protein